MKVVRCSNGHYYDSDKYITCPHCGAENADNNQNNTGATRGGDTPYVQTTTADQYYYTNGMSQVNQNEFKTPNMDLSEDISKEYPPTVSYGHGDFVKDPVTGQLMTRQEYSGINNQVKSEQQNQYNQSSPQNTVSDWQDTGYGSSFVEQPVDYQTGYQSTGYVAESAPTATLNVPVMPSLRQNQFQQVPPNGFGYSDDYYGENPTDRMSEGGFDETMVLTAGGVQPTTEAHDAKAVLTQISTGQKFFITKKETVIGKVNQKVHNDISVGNNTVSRRHASIYIIDSRFFIEDLGSTNKTHINGIEIGSGRLIELKDNDDLVLSDEEFVFSLI